MKFKHLPSVQLYFFVAGKEQKREFAKSPSYHLPVKLQVAAIWKVYLLHKTRIVLHLPRLLDWIHSLLH